MLLKDWPSRVKFVFVDDDWGRGRKNDRFVTSEESTISREDVCAPMRDNDMKGNTYDLLRMHT